MTQLLPFKVGYETYALKLNDVQEVVENQTLHDFPTAPDIVAGAISFHGRIVPVVDLARLLGFPLGKIGQRLIVLVNQRGPVALGVDVVRAVINIEMNQMNQMEDFAERNYISNVINYGGEMMSLFDLDHLQRELELICLQAGGERC